MNDSFGFKLVAVLDINTLILFKAQGLKIIETIKRISIHGNINHKTEKHEGFKSQSKTQSSFYDPHSFPKDIEYIESSRAAAKEIESSRESLCKNSLSHHRTSVVAYGGFSLIFHKLLEKRE